MPVPAWSQLSVDRGDPLPLGMHECRNGFSLKVFNRHASRMSLLLFENRAELVPGLTIELDPQRHRTGDIWHVHLTGTPAAEFYALKAAGSAGSAEGHRYDPDRTLLDPYAHSVAAWGFPALVGRSKPKNVRCSVAGSALPVVAHAPFDWQDDAARAHTWGETVIYETHVHGLSIDPSSGVHRRGEYLGLVEKILYLAARGVTALELRPVHAFDPGSIDRRDPVSGKARSDYWGYNPIALFSPMASYAGRLTRPMRTPGWSRR